jgi:DNA polymerase-3 subunit delta
VNPSELERELDRDTIHPLYFLHGEEVCLMEEAQKRIESLCLVPKTRDFNYDLFFGGETTADRIVDAAKTHPVMAPRRLVIVKDAHLLTSQQVKALTPYCERSSTSTCLVLMGDTLGPWKGCLPMLEKQGRVVLFAHPKGTTLNRYIAGRVARMGKAISPEAVDAVRQAVGNHLGEIYQELDKIVSYVGDRKEIGPGDVEAVISPVRTRSIFDLTRAMGMKDCSEALGALNQMLESGEPYLRILTMIVRQFRLIWLAKEMQSDGISEKEIGRALGVPGFLLQGLLAQSKNFTIKELADGYRRLSETDVALKSRSTSKRLVLESLVVSLCH